MYKSHQAEYLRKSRFGDVIVAGSFLGFLGGFSNFLFLPLMWVALSAPRKQAALHYFTFYAELIPHTEKVVFYKCWFNGKIKLHYVNINSLEKIDANDVPSPLLWDQNVFDSQLVFRDRESGEVFVFDKHGIWN